MIRPQPSEQLAKDAYAAEWKSYTGRERALLRKRRAKLRLQNFHIITQVGQGGYGEVYLARKKDTQEVVALKKMKKTTLAKMDEIKHVLVERDILTATKTPWLVALLYAFQDPSHIYLAMVSFPDTLIDSTSSHVHLPCRSTYRVATSVLCSTTRAY